MQNSLLPRDRMLYSLAPYLGKFVDLSSVLLLTPHTSPQPPARFTPHIHLPSFLPVHSHPRPSAAAIRSVVGRLRIALDLLSLHERGGAADAAARALAHGALARQGERVRRRARARPRRLLARAQPRARAGARLLRRARPGPVRAPARLDRRQGQAREPAHPQRTCVPPAIGAPRLTDGVQRSGRRC
jgi:hypothetical protein